MRFAVRRGSRRGDARSGCRRRRPRRSGGRRRGAARRRCASSEEVGSSRMTSVTGVSVTEKARAISTIWRRADRKIADDVAGRDAVAGKDLVELVEDQLARALAPAEAPAGRRGRRGHSRRPSGWGRATVPGTRSGCRGAARRDHVVGAGEVVAADGDRAAVGRAACRPAHASASTCRRRCGRRDRGIRRRDRRGRRPQARGRRRNSFRRRPA